MGYFDKYKNSKAETEEVKQNTSSYFDKYKKSNDKNLSETKGVDTIITTDEFIDIKSNVDLVAKKINSSSFLQKFNFGIEKISTFKLKENTKKEINNLLKNILSTTDEAIILGYLTKLQKITNEYKVETEKRKKKASEEGLELSEEVLNAPEIKDPKGFILELLEARNGWKNRIESSINEAEKLSETKIVEKIKGTSVYFDVEPEDWDIYFKENNIPKDKQNQFKRYYLSLKGQKTDWFDFKLDKEHDFGNISFINDFGDDISEEAERILNLPEGSTITINIADLNPSSGNLKFKDKKSALLYLYYTKLLFKEVGTFWEDIKQGGINIGEGIGSFFTFIGNHPGETFWTIFSFMTINTIGSFVKVTNAKFVKAEIPIIKYLLVGKYLPESDVFEGRDNEEHEYAEKEARKKAIKQLKDYYTKKGDSKKLEIIKEAEEYLDVLDHATDKEKYRFAEGQFWRKLAQLEGLGKFHTKKSYTFNKWIDILFKPILLNTRGDVTKFARNINDKEKQLKEILQGEILDESGKKIGFLEEAEIFIKRSHKIPNNLENKILNEFNKIVDELKKGNFERYKNVKSKEEFLNTIKSHILKKLNSKFNGLNLTDEIFKGGDNLKDARELFFKGYDEFNPGENNIKLNKWIEILFGKYNLSNRELLQINNFFDDIDNEGGNEYNQRTALDILARIIKKDLTYNEAINQSFEVKWEYIKKIPIHSNLIGSLDNFLKEIDSGKYSLEINENNRRNDINILEESEEVREKISEKGFFDRNWKKIKNFKLFKDKTPEEAEEIIENADEKTKKSFIKYLNKYSELKEKFNLYLEKREAKKIINKTIKYIKSIKDISDKDRKGILETLNKYKNNIEETLSGRNKEERINNLKSEIKILIDYEKVNISDINLDIPKKKSIGQNIKENLKNKYINIVEKQKIIDNINNYNLELAKKQKLINSIQLTISVNEIVDILINEYGEVDKVPEDLLPEDFRKEPRKSEIIKLATENIEEYRKLEKEALEKLELRAILDGDKASEISLKGVEAILEVESDIKYNEGLLKDFVKKANINGIDFEGVKEALENSSKKGAITKKINESGKTELKEFWEKAKELGKDFFKEVKKGKV